MYLLVWTLVLGLGFVRLRTRGDPASLAVWTAFAVAAFFSSVAEEWILWIVAAVVLAAAVASCARRNAWRASVIVAAFALACSMALLGGIVALGHVARPGILIRCSSSGARIVVGADKPVSWVVTDGDVTGLEPGRALREFIAASGDAERSVGVAASLQDVPETAVRLALCGRSAAAGPSALSRFQSLREARTLSPPNPEEWLSANVRGVAVRVYCGEFSPNCPDDERPGLTIVPGAAEHLPRWVEYAVN